MGLGGSGRLDFKRKDKNMKKTRFPALFMAFLLALPVVGTAYAADSPTLVYSSNSKGNQQTLKLDGLPSDCYGVQLTISTEGGKNFSFDLDRTLSKNNGYSVEKQSNDTVTLYITAGENSLNTGSSLTLGTLSSDKAFSIESVSGRLVDSNMKDQTYSRISFKEDGKSSSSGTSSDSSKRYAVEVRVTKGGEMEASPSHASKGTKVTLTAAPDEGYYLDDLTVYDEDDDEVELTEQNSRRYTFTMPASDVRVEPIFASGEEPKRPETPDIPVSLPFRDVPQSEWFYSAVQYVYGNGMMSGTDPDLFSPNVTTTRGMIVTILYRLEGRPAVSAAPFRDVPASQYYASAVAWASENGIVSGYGDGIFGPEDTITREQMASILYRYANYKGYDMSGTADLSIYVDAGKISPYAMTALQWANANGLVSGTTPETLTPGGSATRAQVASILMRFCKNIAG